MNGDRCLTSRRQNSSSASLRSTASSTASLRAMPDLLPKRSRRRLHERNKQQSSNLNNDSPNMEIAVNNNNNSNRLLHDSSFDKENIPVEHKIPCDVVIDVNRRLSSRETTTANDDDDISSRLSLPSSSDVSLDAANVIIPPLVSSARLGLLLQQQRAKYRHNDSDSMSNLLDSHCNVNNVSGGGGNDSNNTTVPLITSTSQQSINNQSNSTSQLPPPPTAVAGRVRQSRRFPLRHQRRQGGQRPPATSVSGVLLHTIHHELDEYDSDLAVGSKSNMLVLSEEEMSASASSDDNDQAATANSNNFMEEGEEGSNVRLSNYSNCSATLLVSTPLNSALPRRHVQLSNVLTPLDQNLPKEGGEGPIQDKDSSWRGEARHQRLRKYQAVTRLKTAQGEDGTGTPDDEWEDSEAGLSHLHDDSEYSLVRSAETKKRGGLRER